MKRSDVMNLAPGAIDEVEAFVIKVKDFIDHVEQKFNDIKDKLEINQVGDLHQIEDAYDIADEMSNNLY